MTICMCQRVTLQCCDTVLVNISVYSYRMASKEKRGRITFRDQCQVCGANSPHVYRHMLRVHLPWYVNPTTSCVDCHVSAGNARELQNMHCRHRLFSGEHLLQAWFLLLNGMFLFISQEMGLGSPMELLGCTVVQEFTPSPLRFSEDEYFFLREYDRRAGLEPLSLGDYMAIPRTRLVVLIHPALLTRLISHLNDQAMVRLKFVTQYTLANGSSPLGWYPTVKRGIIDSHFHLDKFFGRKNRSLSDLEGSKSIPVWIPFAIANYVIPSRWHLLSDHVRADPRIRFTLGVHPHMVTESLVESLFGQLQRMVDKYPEAVGIGEVGLDLTTECRHGCYNQEYCRSQKIQGQLRFLRLAFQLAKQLNKVLVLHIRDQGTSTLAAKQVYDLLKDMDMLDHPIHRHCFVGGYNEYKQWSTDLPNCYFSISPVTVKDPRSMFALSSLDGRKRLLLETDASYLAQYPWNVSNVAEEAAQSFDMTLTELVRVCNRNAARLYSLPW